MTRYRRAGASSPVSATGWTTLNHVLVAFRLKAEATDGEGTLGTVKAEATAANQASTRV